MSLGVTSSKNLREEGLLGSKSRHLSAVITALHHEGNTVKCAHELCLAAGEEGWGKISACWRGALAVPTNGVPRPAAYTGQGGLAVLQGTFASC
jgi:hypothetical protein